MLIDAIIVYYYTHEIENNQLSIKIVYVTSDFISYLI